MYIEPFDIPMKEKTPWLPYDIGICAGAILKDVGTSFPPYLSDFEGRLTRYVEHAKKPKQFPDEYRLYIVDNRLRVLFHALQEPGDTVSLFYEFSRMGRMDEDYCCGDGTVFDEIMDENRETMMIHNAIASFGFVPHDSVMMSSSLIFDGDELKRRDYISTFQAAYLLDRFRGINLIDWDRITKGDLPIDQHLRQY